MSFYVYLHDISARDGCLQKRPAKQNKPNARIYQLMLHFGKGNHFQTYFPTCSTHPAQLLQALNVHGRFYCFLTTSSASLTKSKYVSAFKNVQRVGLDDELGCG